MEENDHRRTFIKQMPKIELHAHLSGSISKQTVRELITLHQTNYPDEEIPQKVIKAFANEDERKDANLKEQIDVLSKDNMQENQIFDAVYDTFFAAQFLIDHLDAVELATRRVLEEFAADNVIYLEIRTTPRHVESKMEQIQHITKVLEVIETMVSKRKIMKNCRLLLSIDRRRSLDIAQETLALYLKLRDESPFGYLLGGIDFSGDARSNDATAFIPVMKKAQDNGIRLAVHLAEIPNEKETCAFLGSMSNESGIAACELYLPLRSACSGLLPNNSYLIPDRIGHGTYIHPAILGGSQRMWDLLVDSEIPLEICLTSNVKCKTAKSYQDHHVRHLLAANHPFVICTDDKGAFDTTLSEEWMHLASTHKLSIKELFHLNLESVKHIFLQPDNLKEEISNEVISWFNDYNAAHNRT